MKSTKLTKQQENFCQAFIRLGDKTAAYREAYNASNMKPETIYSRASKLSNEYKVSIRITELQAITKEISEQEFKHTIYDSLKLDLEMVERYKKHIAILENPESDAKQIEVAKRTIQFIGVAGFNAAQDRISKKQGFYEKDNEQKQPTITLSPEEREKRIAELTAKRNASAKK